MKFSFSIGFVTAGAVFAASSVLAADPFTGYALQLETGYAHNTISRNSPTVSAGGANYAGPVSGSTSTSGVPLFISPGYSFFLAPEWRLGVGIDHQFRAANTRNLSSNFGGQGNIGAVRYYEQITDETNVFVAPGYVIDDKKLVFVKLGYSFESVDLNGKDSKAKTSSGFVVGAGYKQVFTKHFHGVMEVHYAQYGKLSPMADLGAGRELRVNTGTPSVVDLLVGVGYRF